MSEARDVIERAARSLREPVEVDPDAKRRLVAALRQAPPPRVGPVLRAWRWIARPRPVMISPLAGVAAAAIITLVVVLRPEAIEHREGTSATATADAATALVTGGTGAPSAAPAVATAPRETTVRYSGAGGGATVSFRITAPAAASVSLVGDFNDWDPTTHRLRPSAAGDGVWELSVTLEPGRHVYSFLVNGREWIPDPAVARGGDGGFGAPSSVILIGERSS